jgi:hypothetical protein
MTSNSDSRPVSMPSGRSPRRVAPRPHAPDFDRADRIGEFWGYPESTFADQQSGTVVGGVGLAQMALLVNGASSQTVWIGSRSRRSRPESPHTRKDGNGNPRGRLPPPGVPPFFLRADAIGAASDRSRTQSEGRSPSVREVHSWPRFQPQPQIPLRVLHHRESRSVHVRATPPSGWRRWTE